MKDLANVKKVVSLITIVFVCNCLNSTEIAEVAAAAAIQVGVLTGKMRIAVVKSMALQRGLLAVAEKRKSGDWCHL